MKTRLDLLMKSQGLNAVRLAEMIGVQRSGISHIMSGRNKPSFDFIVNILQQFPNISPEWLILGQGSMYKDVTSTINDSETAVIAPKNDDQPTNNHNIDIFSAINSNNIPLTESKQKSTVDKESSTQNSSDRSKSIQNDLSRTIFSGDDIESVIILKRDGSFISYKPGR